MTSTLKSKFNESAVFALVGFTSTAQHTVHCSNNTKHLVQSNFRTGTCIHERKIFQWIFACTPIIRCNLAYEWARVYNIVDWKRFNTHTTRLYTKHNRTFTGKYFKLKKFQLNNSATRTFINSFVVPFDRNERTRDNWNEQIMPESIY